MGFCSACSFWKGVGGGEGAGYSAGTFVVSVVLV